MLVFVVLRWRCFGVTGITLFLVLIAQNEVMRWLLINVLLVICLGPSARATELKPETAAAFDQYVRVTEARMADDLLHNEFLIIDGLAEQRRSQAIAQLQRGEIFITRQRTQQDHHSIRVPNGLIHHWVAVVFIPGATLPGVLAVLQDYDNQQNFYKPVLRGSKLVEMQGNDSKVFLQFANSAGARVVLNANFDVTDVDFGTDRHEIATRSTRVAELSDPGEPTEHELPVGKDHGYMWRLNSYWRVEEKDGGVYIQNESIELSRTIPAILAWFVNPLVESIPRNTLTSLLNNTRKEVLRRQGIDSNHS